MTDEELEKKAEEHYLAVTSEFINEAGLRIRLSASPIEAYIAGAKENGVVWHDLRKNPDDLPEKNKQVMVVMAHIVGRSVRKTYTSAIFLEEWHVTFFGTTTDGYDEVIAWCEIPKFEEGK